MAAQPTAPKRETGPAATFSFSLYPRHIRYVKRRARKRLLDQGDESDQRYNGQTSAVLREIIEAEMVRTPL
jgi:hypothetical protein